MTPLEIVIQGTDLASNVVDDVGGALSGLSDVAAGALTAGLALAATGAAALVTGLGSALSAAMDNELVQARLANVIKSTGGEAGLTAEQANALADQFKNLAGGSDDAVLAIEELALRSGNISAVEMPAFIQSSLDLGAVLGNNAAAADILARAQEDPLAAYKKIEKATGAYSEELEAQIKQLQDSGDTAGALALVMDQLSETTGGAAAANAETLSGQWAIFQETLGEVAETVGMALLPIAHELFDNVIAPAIPLIERLAGEAAPQIAAFVQSIIGGFGGVVSFVQSNMPLIQSTFDTVFGAVLNIANQLATFWTATLQPAILTIFNSITSGAPPAGDVFTLVMNAVQDGAEMVSDFFRDVLIPGMTAAVDWFVENWPMMQETAETVIGYILDVVLPSIMTFLNDVLLPGIQTVLDGIKDFWDEWGDDIGAVFQTMIDGLQTAFDTFSLIFSGDWETLGSNARTAWDEMITGVTNAWNNTDWGALASSALDAIVGAITDGGGAVARAIDGMVQDAINAATSFLSGWNAGGSSGGGSSGGGSSGGGTTGGGHGGRQSATGAGGSMGAGGGNTYILNQYGIDSETASNSAKSFAMMKAWAGEG